VNVPLKLWRSIAKRGLRPFAGLGIVGLVTIGAIHLPTSNSQQVERVASPLGNRTIDLPIVKPTVSVETISERADLITPAGVDVKEKPPVKLNSAQIAFKEARVAVSLSQAQLAQARMNLCEFKAKHDKAKILAAQGKVSRKQADLAVASYKLAQLQHNSAAIGLRDSHTQLIAAKAEVRSLGHKANTVKPM
jgi:hypothetical protein